MKKTKTQKGITLIALIITIVVLLVLASVAINSIQNDGIIGHAQNAASQFEQAQKDEQDVLDYYELMLAGKAWSVGAPVKVKEIVNGVETEVEKIPVKTANMDEPVYVGDTVEYIPNPEDTTTTGLLKNGETSVKLAANDKSKYTYTTVSTFDENYESDSNFTGSTYNFKYTASNKVKWKILGAENGKLLLVSDSTVATWNSSTVNLTNATEETELTNHAIQFKEAGYKNGLNILQNIANIYSHGKGVVGARVLKQADIDRLTGNNPTNYGKGEIHEYGNAVTFTLNENSQLSYVGSNGVSGNLDLTSKSDYVTYNNSNFQYYDEQTGTCKNLKVGQSITIKNTYYYQDYSELGAKSIVCGLLTDRSSNDDDLKDYYDTRRIILGDRITVFEDGFTYYGFARCYFNNYKSDKNQDYDTGRVSLFYSDNSPVEYGNNKYAFNSLRIVVEVDPAYALQYDDTNNTYTLSSSQNNA